MFKRFLATHPAAVVILAVSLAATMTGCHYYTVLNYQNGAERFEKATTVIADRIREKMAAYEQLLRGGQALFYASNHVDRNEWHQYIEALRIDERFPDVMTAGFSQQIERDKLNAHSKTIRDEGLSDYAIRPVGRRDLYATVLYAEPSTELNQRFVGFDLFSDPALRQAMERTRDFGTATLSEKLENTSPASTERPGDLFLFIPIYSSKRTPDWLEVRRQSLHGYAYVSVRADDLLTNILGNSQQTTSVMQIYDDTDTGSGLIVHDSTNKGADNTQHESYFSSTSKIVVAGRTWRLVFRSTADFDAMQYSPVPLIILLVGGTAQRHAFCHFLGPRYNASARRGTGANQC